MPSNTLPPNSGSTATKTKQLSAATLKDGMSTAKAQVEGLKVNVVKATVPKYDKLKAYIDTKAKDDPWSPDTMQTTATGASGKEQK